MLSKVKKSQIGNTNGHVLGPNEDGVKGPDLFLCRRTFMVPGDTGMTPSGLW